MEKLFREIVTRDLKIQEILEPSLSLQRDESARKIFIGGLSYNTTDEGLRTYFEQVTLPRSIPQQHPTSRERYATRANTVQSAKVK
jgi:RNA recognition motif-containing protein